MVMFTCNGHHIEGGEKDSVINARDTGEFVVNIVSYELADAMNRSSASVTRVVDEFDLAGVTKEQSRLVRAPRVKESPVHLECAVHQIIELPCTQKTWTTRMVIGKVLGVHVRDSLIADGMLRPELLRPVARMGYLDYAVADRVFQLERPT